MSKHPRAETNGKGDSNGNGKGHLNGKSYLHIDPVRRQPLRVSVRRSSSLIPALLVLCLFGLVGVVLVLSYQETAAPPQSVAVPRSEAFRLAVNRANIASELTQTATSQEEWKTIASWWEEAVDLMKLVPASSPNIAVAKSRVPAYERNLSYAQARIDQSSTSPFSRDLWAIGLRRADVLRIQGKPSQTERYDSLCKEMLHFGSSTVELNNGIVAHYEDVDRNLKVAVDKTLVVAAANPTVWTLDSPRDHVFRIQGTPSRIIRYDTSDRDVLYYGNSLVYLSEDRVIGYDNLDNNLRVAVTPSGPADQPVTAWTIDSPRDDVFKVQGTPGHVSLDNSSCTETLQYGNSTIEIHNGFVSGYNDADGNLRVKVK